MALTKTQLAKKVLLKLGVIDAGQTVGSDDQTLCDEAYESIYEELAERHLVDWGSGDSIPTWAMMPVRAIVANRIANEYGKPRSLDEETTAMNQMAAYLAMNASGRPIEADYF